MDVKLDYEWTDSRLKWPEDCYDDHKHAIDYIFWEFLWQPHIHFHNLLQIEPIKTLRPAEYLTISKVCIYFQKKCDDMLFYVFEYI